MKVDLNNRVAVVTGAAGALGSATAMALAENGAVVAINDLDNAERTCEEIRKHGGKARAYLADISDVTATTAMVSQIESDLGPIDILVNNAGVNSGKERFPVHQFPDSEWHRILRVDLDGVFYCSRVVSASMVQRRRGAIINIASVFGIVPARLQCAYVAAKAGVVNFTRSHALEVGHYGVRVNGVAPGSILTEGTKTVFYSEENKQKADSLISHIPLGRPGYPEDVTPGIVFLASDQAKYITGHILVIDGGWTAGFSRDW